MTQPLPWLKPGGHFPSPQQAWGEGSEAPGLLAAGGQLDRATLLEAYRQGIFPWFSAGQPPLWWSPNPRMVLRPENFKLHRSLRKTLRKWITSSRVEIRFDHSFAQVMAACADVPRQGQDGTWIVPAIRQAYGELHASGYAHSIETWVDGKLAGGLYCVGIGQAVFGESMFAHRADASKIALAALVGFCLQHGVGMIDCQQNTRHLASLGACEISRETFLRHVRDAVRMPSLTWSFQPVYWDRIMSLTPSL
jgi:leucyl/phenylalanyl-tRNA---protein transferase